MAINLSYPKPRSCQEKIISVARTDTVASIMAWLPKNAVIEGLYVVGAVSSDATTSASVSVGTTATSNELISSFSVLTTTGEGYHPAGAAAVGSAMMTPLTVDTPIYAKYAGVGAETTGGPWKVKIEYYVTGPGETT